MLMIFIEHQNLSIQWNYHLLTLGLSLFSFFDTSRGEICTAPMSDISSYIEMRKVNYISTYIVIRNGTS